MIVMLMVLLPIITGLILPFLKLDKLKRNIYVVLVAVLTSVFAFGTIVSNINVDIVIISLNQLLSIGFKNDGLTKIFIMIIATLWPLATIYATEYMEHEGNQDSFFRYYLIAYGITIGIAFSRNLFSMYLFYELLTFLTLPLIMHRLDEKDSLYAGKVYLTVSILGATIALMGIIIFAVNVGALEFNYGGLINSSLILNDNALYVSYIMMFIGFGVKAAIIPFTYWLPTCGVAPTPVSALLHAVAVVKAGVFAIMRATYYSYGTEFLKGSYAQNIVLIITLITILYGSTMAVKEMNIKRRLAYSTASNLSYILFAVALMTQQSFAAGLIHMMFHAIIKINLFFAAGSMMIYANAKSVKDTQALAKKMPITMVSFLISSLALIGIPLTCGFISKYSLILSFVEEGTLMGYMGVIAIIISAILTLIYLFSIIIPAYFPSTDVDTTAISNAKEAGLNIKFVLIIITILIIYFGCNSQWLINIIENVSKGI